MPTSCDGFECPLGNGQVGNCETFAFEPRYLLATRVTLGTADGAVSAVLRGRASLPESRADADSELSSFGASLLDGAPYGQITNLPLQVSTSDGLLDWSEVAEYRFDDSSGVGQHRVAVLRELPSSALVLRTELQQFPLLPRAHTVFVALRADYPAAGVEPASSDPARVSFRFWPASDCPSNDAACNEAYRVAGGVEHCLAAPAGGGCTIRPAAQALPQP